MATNPNSNAQILAEEEESQTTPLKKTDSNMTDEVIAADPISYCLPDDNSMIVNYDDDDDNNKDDGDDKNDNPDHNDGVAFVTPAKEIVSPPGEAISTSRAAKRRRGKTLPSEWAANWRVESRQRNDGRIDKFYFHNDLGFMCRSIKQVERYETQKIRPGRNSKTEDKEQENNSSIGKEVKEMPAMEEKEVLLTHEMPAVEEKEELRSDGMLVVKKEEKADAKRAQLVEEFLAEAHYNLLHKCDP